MACGMCFMIMVKNCKSHLILIVEELGWWICGIHIVDGYGGYPDFLKYGGLDGRYGGLDGRYGVER